MDLGSTPEKLSRNIFIVLLVGTILFVGVVFSFIY